VTGGESRAEMPDVLKDLDDFPLRRNMLVFEYFYAGSDFFSKSFDCEQLLM